MNLPLEITVSIVRALLATADGPAWAAVLARTCTALARAVAVELAPPGERGALRAAAFGDVARRLKLVKLPLKPLCCSVTTLQWARANGCPWDGIVCAYAALGGHLEVLQWARANDCPWGKWCCAYAAMNGHLAVLQWARANGCPWGRYTCMYAAQDGHLAVLEWARASGAP